MKYFIWQNWLKRLHGINPFCTRRHRLATHPFHHTHLELELLEDRTLPSATVLTAATDIMQPTYQILQPKMQVTLTPNLTPNLTANVTPAGYSPAEIRTAYGIDKITLQGGASGTGAGQTIALVDAYDDPTAASDLVAFDQEYNLPAANFVKVGINAAGQASTTSFPTPDEDWSIEIALDVEWAHSVAPQANILLVEANSASYADLLTAVDYARNYPKVSTVSMSWGGSEFAGETAFDTHFVTPAGHNGVTFFASSGDSASPALTPSVSTHVVSVGGTSLTVDSSNDWEEETGWSEGGGGISEYITAPSYQNGLTIYDASANGMRAVPDVSYDADPYTGVAVLSTYGYGGWLQVGGTSASSPQWAAIVAIADQGRALAGEGTLDGFTQTLPDLYKLPSSDFHDIVQGDNGYLAGPGYDLVTGLGSPVANYVVADLIGVPQVYSSVSVTPAANTVGDNNQEQLTAVALDQFGRPMLSQPTFTWSLVNGVGTIDNNGLYTAPATGAGTDTVTVTATINNVTFGGSATVDFEPGPSITQISASPSEVTGTTTTLSATVSDNDPPSVTYFWFAVNSPLGATTPLFTNEFGQGTDVNFFEAGSYQFELSVTDWSGVTDTGVVTVTVDQTFTNIVVTPGTVTLANGAQQQFTASAVDQFGYPMATQPAFAWSLVSGLGTIGANGVYTAPSTGTGIDTVGVLASENGITLNATVAVTYAPGIEVTSISATPSIITGLTTTVSATVAEPGDGYVFGFWYGLDLPAGGVEPLFTNPLSDTTTATFYEPGVYTLSFMAIDLTGNMTMATVNVDVVPTVSSVFVLPMVTYVGNGAQQQFTAVAYDQFYNPMASNFTWAVTNKLGSVTANGLYTAPATGGGTAYVQATANVNGATASGITYVILVQPPKIQSISATPNPVTSTTLTVAAFNADDSTLSYSWQTVAEPAGAKAPTFSAAGAASTKATFYAAGTYTFQVAVTSDTDQTTLGTINVTVNQALTSITLTPTTAIVPDATQKQFSAAAFDQFQNPMPANFAWSIASGPGSINGSTGLYTAPASAPGTAIVKASATQNNVTLSRTATVTLQAPPTISSITASAVTGTTTNLKVTATNPAGGTLTYAWKVTAAPAGAKTPAFSAATAAAATATFYQAGTYTFQVAVTNQTRETSIGNVTVTVKSTFTYLTMTPATTTVLPGHQQQFAVQALDQFHIAMAAPTVTWSLTGPGSLSTSGLYKAPASGAGSATVQAKLTINGVTLIAKATVTI